MLVTSSNLTLDLAHGAPPDPFVGQLSQTGGVENGAYRSGPLLPPTTLRRVPGHPLVGADVSFVLDASVTFVLVDLANGDSVAALGPVS